MLPPNYIITEKESDEALGLWCDADQFDAMSTEQRRTIELLMDASKLGRWPVTVAEVEEFLEKENKEYWLSRFGVLPPQ